MLVFFRDLEISNMIYKVDLEILFVAEPKRGKPQLCSLHLKIYYTESVWLDNRD